MVTRAASESEEPERMTKKLRNIKPITHLLGEYGYSNYLLIAIDGRGAPDITQTRGSLGAQRALLGFAEDWVVSRHKDIEGEKYEREET